MDVIFLLKLIGFGGQRSQPRSEDGTERPSSAGPVDKVQFVLRSAGYVFHEAERLINGLDSFYSGKGLSAAAPVVVEQLLEAPDLTPRERMLKNPHAVKGDAGVDDTVAVNGSEAVPKSSQQHESETILSNVHSLVSSVYGYGYGALIDGRRGSCRSYTDSEGNHYSVTVKSIGSRSYTVTEKTSLTGLKEKTEEFENMSERDIKLFEEEFNGEQSSSNYIRVLYDYVPSASDTRRLKNYIVDNMPKWF